jgi:UDP-N-acetylmuramate--alanine ligase
VLGRADAVWLTEVYAAGEAPIAGADGAALARACGCRRQGRPQFVDDVRRVCRRRSWPQHATAMW